MPNEINWERTGYESRVDVLADEISVFVTEVLRTIDVDAARASRSRWDEVCRYFAGCARAARAQGATPRAGGKRIATHLAREFPSNAEGSNEGFFEFMDWLSNPAAFEAAALRSAIEKC